MEFDDPWDWFRPHTCLEENYCSSSFDFGIDCKGQVLVAKAGHAKTIPLDDLQKEVTRARMEMITE